jgi:phosphonate transport system permease protein
LLFAAIFVRALRIGPLPGILALGLHSIGMIGKLFADAIEQTPALPREAVRSVGARKWQAIWTSVIPQAMPGFISTALYRLDINLRSASVLGLVGAGGIGVWLKQMTGSLQWNKALGIVIVLFVFITVMELLSALVRATLLGGERTMVGRRSPRFSLGAKIASTFVRNGDSSGGVRRFDQSSVRPPLSGERLAKLTYGGLFAALLALAFYFVRLNPWTVVTKIPEIWRIGTRMFPLDFTTARDGIITGLTQSIAIALMATFFGFLFALPLGLLAARNVTANRIVYALARLSVTFVRGMPELIVCVIFVAAIGLGPVAGIFALVVGTTGFFSKLVADAAEEVDPVPREGVFATGATRLQETTTSVIPQAMPSIIGNLLYVLDINLRTSAILGIVGGGGIGTLLMNSIKVLKWETTGAILLSLFVIVYGIELLAGWIRKQIL